VDGVLHAACDHPAKLQRTILPLAAADLEISTTSIPALENIFNTLGPLMQTYDDHSSVFMQKIPGGGHCSTPNLAGNLLSASATITSHPSSESANHVEHHPATVKSFGIRSTFMNKFDNNLHAEDRREHLFYPFSSREEWQLASFLLCSGLSMA
jgi:hypothetical protein